jgi:PAS domain S-box-containing protein
MVDRSADIPSNIDVGLLGRSMLEAAAAARIGVTIAVVEPGGPRNVFVSEAAADILGWSVEELTGANPMTLVSERDGPYAKERLQRRMEGERGTSSYDLCTVRKDGSQVFITVTCSTVVLEGRTAVFAFVVDFTARRLAEQSRAQSDLRFRELIEKGPEPIAIIRGGYFVYANLAFASALGYDDAAEMCRLPLTSHMQAEHVGLLQRRMEILLNEGGRLPPQLYQCRRRDGSTVLLEATSVFFEFEGQPSILTMARDVTERRALEARLEQADRLAALGTMAAGVAHEINNPLAYMMLNLEWIARKLPEARHDPSGIEALTEMIKEARLGAERVATIVRELRSFSRADGETRRKVDLETVVKSAIRIVSHEVRHRARITTSFTPIRPLWANESRVEQVALNLLLNAAQSMPEAGPNDNEISIVVRPDAEGRAVLEVADNGQGIPPDVLPRIFDPFFTTKPPGVGTGLGLSICHGIVSSLGGHITVHSGPGEGTVFRVVFPTATDDEDPTSNDPASSEPLAEVRVKRARILVIDDEIQIANTLRELLSLEHEVTATTSAREALSLVRGGTDFDVIFCDLMMPQMSGMELYRRLREQRRGIERRIVFMTGGAFTTRAAEFLASVDNRRIEKPFSLGLVERLVRDVSEK